MKELLWRKGCWYKCPVSEGFMDSGRKRMANLWGRPIYSNPPVLQRKTKIPKAPSKTACKADEWQKVDYLSIKAALSVLPCPLLGLIFFQWFLFSHNKKVFKVFLFFENVTWAVYCHLAYLTCMQSTSCKMPDWMKHKPESRLQGEISITSDMQMIYHPYGRRQRGTKEPLDESERGEWKSWIKTQHSKSYYCGTWSHHFMENRWGNNGNSDRLYVLGLQNHCRWWAQPWN